MLGIGKHTNAQLADQIVALQNEVSRLSRELATLKAHTHSASISVQRSGCAGIADKIGINERTVRQVLTSHTAFARVRQACAKRGSVITRDRDFLNFLSAGLDDGSIAWPS